MGSFRAKVIEQFSSARWLHFVNFKTNYGVEYDKNLALIVPIITRYYTKLHDCGVKFFFFFKKKFPCDNISREKIYRFIYQLFIYNFIGKEKIDESDENSVIFLKYIIDYWYSNRQKSYLENLMYV